jgi:deoxyribodipyrimidine photo-lyase
MWFASIWIFTLGLPWQLGADLFYRHLLDGDPASNTLGWRWVAGLHTKGKTYLARASNIARYTNGRFDPKGQLAETAPALVEPDVGAAVPVPPGDPVPDDTGFGLLVTEEDGAPETLALPRPPAAVIGLVATDARSPLAVGAAARAFAAGAVADALQRAGERFGVAPRQAETAHWGAVLTAFAREAGVNTIVTASAPVGPVAEQLDGAQRDLEAAGIRLLRMRRPFDAHAWPYATKGFFALKAKIPRILSTV